MQGASVALEGGFDDYVFDSQSTFRALMDAMARPGTAQAVAAGAHAPEPLSPSMAAVALTLCDFDTPIWLDGELAAAPGVGEWLRFQTGAQIVAHPAQAAFAFVVDKARMPAFLDFAQGTQEYPDRSTTLVIAIEAVDGGDPLVLSGPGIEATAPTAPRPLRADFVEQCEANRARAPRGVDIILAGSGEVLCLPRSTAVRRG